MRGIYCIMAVCSSHKEIQAGKLETVNLAPGYYYYVGSGMNSLLARVERHFAEQKKKRWHVDYLFEAIPAYQALLIETEHRLECRFSSFLNQQFKTVFPAQGFGSSDCRCISHLHYSQTLIPIKKIQEEFYGKLASNMRSDKSSIRRRGKRGSA